jgi:uncharacterized membrane protein
LNLRLALYELAERHALDAGALAALCRLAGLEDEPEAVAAWVPRVVAALAAALLGLGAVFWVAAHWGALGRLGQFALLQGAVLAVAVAAAAWPVARGPLALLALLAVGALFAFFGQTYQTGADAWQLFALWAALALPLALAARSDLVWAPWALVSVCAVSLWVQVHTAHRWRFESQDAALHALGWGAAVAVAAVLGPWLARFTGAGRWSYRTATVLAVFVVSGSALGALFGDTVAPQYGLALGLAAAALWALATPRGYDIFGLSAVAFAADVLLVAGLARLLVEWLKVDAWVLFQLPLGLAAAALLAVSVSGVMRVARARRAQGIR